MDPQRGDTITIIEAISRGILDPEGANEVLVPLNSSLSIPQLFKQGLIDPETQKIIHPETGALLSISEAIVCDIVDPLSTVNTKFNQNITLSEALETGMIDDDRCTVDSTNGPLSLQDAVKIDIFDNVVPSGPVSLAPAGMTLPVALKRGLVDIEKKEVTHPITKEVIPLEKAIQENFIMSLPFVTSTDAVKLDEAIDLKLIDPKTNTFTSPTTGEKYPLAKAIEKGLLILKTPVNVTNYTHSTPVTTLTQTVDTVHTVTTKTIEISSGYAFVNKNEVQNIETGQVISMEEARLQGIVKDVNETKNKTIMKDIKMSFSDALHKGLVDMNAGTFTDPLSGEKVPIKEALTEGKLTALPKADEEVVGEYKTTELNVAEAFQTIYNEETGSFVDPNDRSKRMTFKEALETEIIDGNSMIYDVNSQKPVTVEQAVQQGLIDAKSGKVTDQKTGKKVDFKEATKKD